VIQEDIGREDPLCKTAAEFGGELSQLPRDGQCKGGERDVCGVGACDGSGWRRGRRLDWGSDGKG